jgi:predicted cupin superfamily sugar epimerase
MIRARAERLTWEPRCPANGTGGTACRQPGPAPTAQSVHATARELIDTLGLAPLPEEGGFFRVTWRGAHGSAILFLITSEDFSALHRIAEDELWHFHAGDPVEHARIDPSTGALSLVRLGTEVARGETPQLAVPAGHWQGARLAASAHGYALLGCTVTPPWTPAGFSLGSRDALLAAFPRHAAVITRFTR